MGVSMNLANQPRKNSGILTELIFALILLYDIAKEDRPAGTEEFTVQAINLLYRNQVENGHRGENGKKPSRPKPTIKRYRAHHFRRKRKIRSSIPGQLLQTHPRRRRIRVLLNRAKDSIHRTNCPNAARLLANYGHRVVKTKWAKEQRDILPYRFTDHRAG